jgi:hypothetical protein
MANLFALTALLCWIPISAAMFLWLPMAKALSVSYVAGWLLLPFATYQFPGIPDFSKATAILIGCCLGLLLHKDAGRVLGTFRVSWIDIPAFALCIGALVTSIINGLGVWDGVAASFEMLGAWSGPYLLARIAYRSLDDLRQLAEVIVLGGLFYVPLCLFEIRMSPQLHIWIYGFAPRGWGDIRFGGWRPSVFLECGLELGMWMTACSLVGCCLWHQGRYRKFFGVPTSLLVFVLLVTTILCRSTGALVLFILGLGCWVIGRYLRTGTPLAILLISSAAYIIVRSAGLYDGAEVVDFARRYVAEDRAHSLEFRLNNEDLLAAKALERPWFGWGGWGRSRVYDDYGKDAAVTDGYWIIMFGRLGLVGLLATYGILWLPCLAAIRRYGVQLCRSDSSAPVAALVLVVALFAFDSLLNDFPNPVYLVSAGAVGSIAQLGRVQSFRRRTDPATSTCWPAVQRRSWPPPIREHPATTDA